MLSKTAERHRTVPRDVVMLTALFVVSVLPVHAQFVDVTNDSGIDYVQAELGDGCLLGDGLCEAERMAGGAAVADVDGDDDLDLFVTRLDGPDILYVNQGGGRFSDATPGSGLDEYDTQSNGALFVDIDNDGDQDLYVTVLGNGAVDPVNNRNYLFINDGTGVFTERAIERGAALASVDTRRPYSVSQGDFNRDGWVDLHINVWMAGPQSSSRLLLNKGVSAPGFFSDVTDRAGVPMGDVYAFGSSFSDLDNDGWPDLAVTADFGTSRLYWNNGDGTFSDGTSDAAVGTDENGMGSSIADIDGDGDLDWFITSIYDPQGSCEDGAGCSWGYTGNRLFRNDGDRRFVDITDEAGVRDGGWGWGGAMFDFDNDGDLDLGMTNGVDFAGTMLEAPFHDDATRLWVNESGVFTEGALELGIDDRGSGKGYLVFDYDADGDQDVFIVNNAGRPKLYRNDTGDAKSWLRVEPKGIVSNRDAVGAKVYVKSTVGAREHLRVIGSASHFLGQSERAAHFGLGEAVPLSVASVRIEWPSGIVSSHVDVPANSTLIVEEPVPTVALHAAVLPSARVLRVGTPATVMATLINAGSDDAHECTVRLADDLPVLLEVFAYARGAPWQRIALRDGVTVAAGEHKSVLLAMTASAPFDTVTARLIFDCRDARAAQIIAHVNTLTLSGGDGTLPDVVAVAASAGGDGVVSLAESGQSAFAIATTNVGSFGKVHVLPRATKETAVSVAVCRTEPGTGACLAPPVSELAIDMPRGATMTFGVFVRALDDVTFAPASNRVVVDFANATRDLVCGSTSVAVQ